MHKFFQVWRKLFVSIFCRYKNITSQHLIIEIYYGTFIQTYILAYRELVWVGKRWFVDYSLCSTNQTTWKNFVVADIFTARTINIFDLLFIPFVYIPSVFNYFLVTCTIATLLDSSNIASDTIKRYVFLQIDFLPRYWMWKYIYIVKWNKNAFCCTIYIKLRLDRVSII